MVFFVDEKMTVKVKLQTTYEPTKTRRTGGWPSFRVNEKSGPYSDFALHFIVYIAIYKLEFLHALTSAHTCVGRGR
jgi:hypothetical protein